MTQEVRITVDANLYYRCLEGEFDKDLYGLLWKSNLEDLTSKLSRADHKFINVKVDVIPHDNDRDYTEEDAEKHLYGEKRKTYEKDFFEKFPEARRADNGRPAFCRDSVYGLKSDCGGRSCRDCWRTAMPDEREDADA